MKKTSPLAVRLDPDVKAALENEASAQERSLSWMINRILRDHLKVPVARTGKTKSSAG